MNTGTHARANTLARRAHGGVMALLGMSLIALKPFGPPQAPALSLGPLCLAHGPGGLADPCAACCILGTLMAGLGAFLVCAPGPARRA